MHARTDDLHCSPTAQSAEELNDKEIAELKSYLVDDNIIGAG